MSLPQADLQRTLTVGVGPAGTGASFFLQARQHGLDVIGIDLRGRGTRSKLAPATQLDDVVRDAGTIVNTLIRDRGPVTHLVMVGHSFGAVVAWQVLDRIFNRSPRPELGVSFTATLIVSGAMSPQRPRPHLTHLPDAALVSQVARLTGYSADSYSDPVLRPSLVPCLRADLTCLNDPPPSGPAMDALVYVIRAESDPLVAPDSVEGWAATSVHDVSEVVVPGGHMHPLEDPRSYAHAINMLHADALARHRSRMHAAI